MTYLTRSYKHIKEDLADANEQIKLLQEANRKLTEAVKSLGGDKKKSSNIPLNLLLK